VGKVGHGRSVGQNVGSLPCPLLCVCVVCVTHPWESVTRTVVSFHVRGVVGNTHTVCVSRGLRLGKRPVNGGVTILSATGVGEACGVRCLSP